MNGAGFPVDHINSRKAEEEHSPGRIVVIDADVSRASYLEGNILMWGYQVHSSRDGAEGIQLIKELNPDLVFISLYMPRTPGLTLLKEIRADESLDNFPIFMVTEEISEEVRIVSISSGAEDLIQGDISAVDLSMKVQNALEIFKYRRKINELNRRLEREKELLLRYFSSDLVEKILSEEIRPELGGELVDATVMFFDIRKSTSIAESVGAKIYAEFISGLFTELITIIYNYKGSVNEILGDGILATFGCPVHDPDHRSKAVRAALAIREKLNFFNSNQRPDYLKEDVGFGLGLASGRIFAGNIGSRQMLKYAVMGPAVNRAARIQELTKTGNHTILIDSSVTKNIPESIQLHEAGNVELRGIGQMASLYAPIR